MKIYTIKYTYSNKIQFIYAKEFNIDVRYIFS